MGEKIRGDRNNDLDLTDKNRALDIYCILFVLRIVQTSRVEQ